MSVSTLRVAGVPEHFNLPWQLALEHRAFAQAGLDLRWTTVPGGTGEMCRLLRAGELDLAVMITEGAVRDILMGNPSRIVAGYVDSPLTWGVHVGARSGLNGPNDLIGVPFAISRPNSGSHLVAMAYAQTLGWTPAEEDLVVVNDLEGALERLEQDPPVVFLWELSTTARYVHQGRLRRVDEYRPPWPCFVVVARQEVLEQRSVEVRTALRVVQEEARALLRRKRAPELVAQRCQLSLDDARAWFRTVRWNTSGTIDTATLATVARKLHLLGMVPQLPPAGGSEAALVHRG